MNRSFWMFLCVLLMGCEALDDSESSLDLACDCVSVSDRLTPTYSCIAEDISSPLFLCEDGAAGLECEESLVATWSAEDLSCASVYCVTTDPSTCQVDCSCSEVSGR